MSGLEGMVASENIKNSLLNKSQMSEVLSDVQLNTPIEKDANQWDLLTKELKAEDRLSVDELNKPVEKEVSNEVSALSFEEKVVLKEETNWSDEVVNSIRTPEEANVYKNADLKDVNGNLQRTDIDWNAKIPQDRIDRMRSMFGDEVADKWQGKTNLDLIKEGKAPYGRDGEWINLHHVGQKADSPLAELTNTEHKTYDSILHDKTKSSEIERPIFKKERETYWQNRYEEYIHKA
jgi:hypothetical protein